jgi:hypothetical protein
MEEWITDKRMGTQIGIILILLLIVIDFVLIGVLTAGPIGPITFLSGSLIVASIPAIGLIVYQLIGLARSGYALDRNMLTIDWGPIRQVVPTEAIQLIMLGTEVQGSVKKFRGWRWPGLMVGQGDVPDAGLTLFYSSASLAHQLIVVTPTLSYAISPTDVPGFIESIKARYELGPTQAVTQTTQHPPLFDWALWRDRIAQVMIAAGAMLCLALFALVCFRYPDLPARLPLHYSIDGVVDRSGPTSQAFMLPLIGTLVLMANITLGLVAYNRERMAAYLLWGGMLLVQLLLWVGAIGLLKA